VAVAGQVGEHGAEAAFGARVAVERGRVEIADAGIPRSLECTGRFRVARHAVEVAHLGATKTHEREVDIGTGKLTGIGNVHDGTLRKEARTICDARQREELSRGRFGLPACRYCPW